MLIQRSNKRTKKNTAILCLLLMFFLLLLQTVHHHKVNHARHDGVVLLSNNSHGADCAVCDYIHNSPGFYIINLNIQLAPAAFVALLHEDNYCRSVYTTFIQGYSNKGPPSFQS